MNLKQLITTTCVTALITGASFAQGNRGLIDVSKLDGKKVTNLQGENLGDLHQVLVDPQSGRLRYAVIELDKLWQINDPEVAVPWTALKVTKQGDKDFKIQLDATKEKLTKAPKFKVGDADRIYSREAAQPVYSYWSIIWVEDPPASGAGATGTGTSGASSKSGAGTTGTGTSTTNPKGATGAGAAGPKTGTQ